MSRLFLVIFFFATKGHFVFGNKDSVKTNVKFKSSVQQQNKITKANVKHKDEGLKQSQDKKKALTIDEIKNIQRTLIKYPALSLSFEQKTYRSLRNKEQYHLGQIYLVGTGKFHWQIESLSVMSNKNKKKEVLTKKKGKKEILIFDGNALFSFSEGASYAIQYPTTNSKGIELKQLVDMIMNFDSLLEKYSIQETSQEKNDVYLTLTPKGKSETKKIKLVVELVQVGKAKSTQIKELVLYFENDNYSSFKFSNHREEKVDLSRLLLPKGLKVNKAL